MTLMDNFYKKINGSYFAFLGSSIFLIAIFIASGIYFASDPSFNIMTHWVSDLGEGPNFSNYVFNTGEIITGICYILFFLFLTKVLYREKKMKIPLIISFIISIIASIGLILAGIFPMYAAPLIHKTVATICFIGMCLSFIIFGYIESLIEDIPKLYSLVSYIISSIIIIFMISYLLDEVKIVQAREFYLFFEWFSVFSIIMWFFSQGICTLKLNEL